MLFVVESGLRVRLSDPWFRIQDLPTYSGLRGQSVSEMDFGFWDGSNNAITLLEVKNLSHPRAGRPDRESLAHKLRSNVKDTLVMFHAAWTRVGSGAALAAELPEICRTKLELRLFFVLRTPGDNASLKLLASLQDVVAMAARGYAALLGLDVKAAVLPVERAREKGLPVEIAEEG